MTGLRALLLSLCAAGLLSVVGCSYIRSILEPLPPDVPSDSVKIEGQVARAAGIAIADLMALRQSSLTTATQTNDAGTSDNVPDASSQDPDAGTSTVTAGQTDSATLQAARECMARLESYDIRVWWEDDHYTVWIYPVPERCFGGSAGLNGGGARYAISNDFKILWKKYEE